MRFSRHLQTRALSLVGTLALALSVPQPAQAQFDITFEPPSYTSEDPETPSHYMPLPGQDGWFLPETSDPFLVLPYLNNPFGLPTNPMGGDQFAGGENKGSNVIRTQRAFAFDGKKAYRISYDICAALRAAPPDRNTLSSVSLQPGSLTQFFTAINFWGDLENGMIWNGGYRYYTYNGRYIFVSTANSHWETLKVKNWYRQTVTFDLDTNLIYEISLTDLMTNTLLSKVEVGGWYLYGGVAKKTPISNVSIGVPNAVRIFVGGNNANANAGKYNICAFDNLKIEEAEITRDRVSLSGKVLFPYVTYIAGKVPAGIPLSINFFQQVGDKYERQFGVWTVIEDDGNYKISGLPRGKYKLWIKAPIWLAKVIDLDTTSGDVVQDLPLLPGDANNDNGVNIFDLGRLAEAFNSYLGDSTAVPPIPPDPNYDDYCDFNRDRHVDIFDLAILAELFNTDGDPFP